MDMSKLLNNTLWSIHISDYDKDLIYSKIMELNNNTKEVRKQHVKGLGLHTGGEKR
ncbi:MAG: hypothetical protein JG781_1565 [Peptococcaceae bacterium]|jgi:hypothetical protein|nr:hypothetical protein [Peptococcaceae bacterium]